MNRYEIAKYIALGATVLAVLGVGIGSATGIGFFVFLGILGVLLSLVAYVFGGLGKALSMVWNIAKWGLIAFPMPLGAILFCFSGMFAILVFLCIPIIPVMLACKERNI